MPLLAETKHVQAVLDIERYKTLRVFCIEQQVSLQDLLRHILEEWIDKHSKEVTQDGEEKTQ